MTMPEDSGSPRDVRMLSSSRRWLLFLVLAVLLTPLGAVVAGQLASNTGSPATGHAQVITQGIADFAGQDMVWRLVERTALPRTRATFGDSALSFILASEEPILLTNATDLGEVNVARLAKGEAFQVSAGTRQKRASMTDQPVPYLALELVPRDQASLVGEGRLILTTDTFSSPAGSHDLDFVRDVLAAGEETVIPDSGQSNVVLASEGAIDVVPTIGQMRTLQAGEAGIFEGELRIRPATGAFNADMPLAAALTRSLGQNTTSPRNAFVAGVIGVEIPPVATATPTQVPVQPTSPPPTLAPASPQIPTDTPTQSPTETATATPTETATLAPTDTPTATREPIAVLPIQGDLVIRISTPTPTPYVIE